LINKIFNCARVRNEIIYRGEKLEKLGWCATFGTPCYIYPKTEGDLEALNIKMFENQFIENTLFQDNSEIFVTFFLKEC